MKGPKKFSAFSGVFTPSILTILGVIMYLRLGWVVGQAGLWTVLGIIIVAHLISITTGLSVSSMATDKKIKTGGIYYVLSRSLGLPMGGAIGLILFIGTAIGISLYIVGFVENFLAIDAIREFVGLDQSVNSIRIIGSIALIVLVTIAFISTSLAIKTQYFVLAAIALSLVSIFLGFFLNTAETSRVWISSPIKDFNLMLVFAVFFPAVTGFTAGVAMSGDLKDPKKDIPKGTLLAIAAGFVIYVGLAIAIAYFLDRDLLLGDNSALMNIAYFSPLVIAGIWGATLSSALGGILGGPRIMQAIAMDKLLPKVFAKGSGSSNEPRNALIFTFIIAETGILIGDLNAIAALVTIFYISAYGFINLSFALEKWSSTDFNPSFKVTHWVGVIGFIISIAIMFQLNPLAMFAAFILLGVLYFLLKRRNVELEYGDVWTSVRSTIVRDVLTSLNKKTLEERNWQPNIILFSGQSKTRKYLVDIGKSLVGQFGFLSNFELIKKENADQIIIKKQEQSESNVDEKISGFFHRKHEVTDIYEGMQQISSFYGFSGIEPNTVMLGWAKNSDNPEKFIETLEHINKLDLNLLLVDYDKERKSDENKTIDIWWRGGGHNGNLALHLVKIISRSKEWVNTKIRIIIVNPKNKNQSVLHKNADNILENLRIKAEVKIINNEIENRSFFEILKLESKFSDLIFLGLPNFSTDNNLDVYNRINELRQAVGTLIMVKSSESFENINIGTESSLSQIKPINQQEKIEVKNLSENIIYPDSNERAKYVKRFYSYFNKRLDKFQNNELYQLLEEKKEVYSLIKQQIQKSFLKINYTADNYSDKELSIRLSEIHSDFLQEIQHIYEILVKEKNEYVAELINNIIKAKLSSIYNIIDASPSKIKVYYDAEEIKRGDNKLDNFEQRKFKFYSNILFKFGRKEVAYTVNYKDIIKQFIIPEAIKKFEDIIKEIGSSSHLYVIELKTTINKIDDIFNNIQNTAINESEPKEKINKLKSELLENINDIETEYAIANNNLYNQLNNNYIELSNKVSELLNTVAPNSLLKEDYTFRRRTNKIRKSYSTYSNDWLTNQQLVCNQLLLDINLLKLQSNIFQIFNDTKSIFKSVISTYTKQNQNIILSQLNNYLQEYQKNPEAKFNLSFDNLKSNYKQNFGDNIINGVLIKIKKAIRGFPETIEILNEEDFNKISSNPFDNFDSIRVAVTQLLDYLINKEFIEYLKTVLDQTQLEIQNINSDLSHQIKFIKYGLIDINDQEKDSSEEIERAESLILEEKEKLSESINKTDSFIQETTNKLDSLLISILDKLSIYPFISTAKNLKQYIRERKEKGNIKAIKFFRNISGKIKHQFGLLIYKQSRGWLITRQFIKSGNPHNEKLNSLFELNSISKTPKEVSNKIPFYYKQLFLRKHNYLNDFWHGRKDELQNAENLLKMYKNGLKGAICVYGERHSGKSFFAQYLISKHLGKHNVYNIIPPQKGSSDIDVFDEKFRESLNLSGSDEEIFTKIDSKSVIIFEDIELWWEKSLNGLKVIEKIKKLIDLYSEKVIFITTINNHTFKLLNKISNFNDSFIGNIEMPDVDSESLKEIVINRHKTYSIKFNINGKDEENFLEWDYAKVFNSYFKLSQGNIGFSLIAWINSITDFKDNTIYMSKPIKPSYSFTDNLNADQIMLLTLFVLHKTITVDKLSRLTNFTLEESENQIQTLKRFGLIHQSSNGVYKTDRMLHHLIVKELENKNFI